MADSRRPSARARLRYQRALDAVALSAPDARRRVEPGQVDVAEPAAMRAAPATSAPQSDDIRDVLVASLREDKATTDVLRGWLREALTEMAPAAPQHTDPPAEQEDESAKSAPHASTERILTRDAPEDADLGPGVRRIRRAATPSAGAAAPPMMPTRCSEHGGQHYVGAREQDVIDVWTAMRENYQRNAPNKVAARKSLMRWLEHERGVCPESILWYLDFFVVRSCPARAPEGHPAQGEAGWYIAFDPNGDKYLRSSLFAEAFDGAAAGFGGVTPRLLRPAWLPETERARIAELRGESDSRPFPPSLLDGATSSSFYVGQTEH